MPRKHLLSGLVLLLFVGIAAGSDESSTDRSPERASNSSTSATSNSTPSLTKAEYVQQIGRELESIRTFDGSTYRGSKDAINIEVVLFGAWAKIIHDAGQYDLSEAEKARVNQFRQRISAIQARELPRMRAAWARLVRDAMWEHDVTVTAGGDGYRTLRLTSVVVASNGNIAEIQRTLHDQLQLLRFKRIEYRWYRGADEYTYYTVDSPPDRAVRQITENGFAAE
jgi:hypothetical protein